MGETQHLPSGSSQSDGGGRFSFTSPTQGGGGEGPSPPPTQLSVSPHPLFPSCHFSHPSSALCIYFILTHLPVSSPARAKAPGGQNRNRSPQHRQRTPSAELAGLRLALWRSHYTPLKFTVLDCFVSISCCNVCDNAVSCTGGTSAVISNIINQCGGNFKTCL